MSGATISLETDVFNSLDQATYAGTLSGRRFTATFESAADYLDYDCQLKGGTLSGTFSADFQTLEADETLVFGPPNAEARVQVRWTGSRF
jgi:hypothetical protein